MKSRQIAAYYYLTFLWLAKQLVLSIKQPSQATNSFSQEDRDGRHRTVASRRTNNGGKEDLTLLMKQQQLFSFLCLLFLPNNSLSKRKTIFLLLLWLNPRCLSLISLPVR